MPACDSCYRRKVKCSSKMKEACSRCIQQGLACKFHDSDYRRQIARVKRHFQPNRLRMPMSSVERGLPDLAQDNGPVEVSSEVIAPPQTVSQRSALVRESQSFGATSNISAAPSKSCPDSTVTRNREPPRMEPRTSCDSPVTSTPNVPPRASITESADRGSVLTANLSEYWPQPYAASDALLRSSCSLHAGAASEAQIDVNSNAVGVSTSLAPTKDDVAEQGIARTVLDDFFSRDIINSRSWHIPTSQVRSIYTGSEISNLAQLINLAAHDNETRRFRHFPFPQIRPAVPWQPHQKLSAMKWLSSAAIGDSGALPAEEIRDELIKSFFTKIHPGFPIVDEELFRRQYADKSNPPPLLLFQAILLAGAHVCSHPKVAQNRAWVKSTFFRRAKTLFDLHHENDRTNVIQAALLFTWHFEGADDASANAFYWTGVAARIASAMGIHRDLSRSVPSRMPAPLRRLYRRIWWTLVQLDAWATLHHGYSLCINLDDCDQPPLEEDDFLTISSEKSTAMDAEYCIHSSSLSLLLISILRTTSPGSIARAKVTPNVLETNRAKIVADLGRWLFNLPPCLDLTSRASSNFWALQLHMHYNLLVLHIHRPCLQNCTKTAYIAATSPETSELCKAATAAMTTLLERISYNGALNQCWFDVQTVVVAISIQRFQEIRYAIRTQTLLLTLEAQRQLESLLPWMQELAVLWPIMEAISRRFAKMLEKCKVESASLFNLESDAEMPNYHPALLDQDKEGQERSPQLVLPEETFSGMLMDWDWSNYNYNGVVSQDTNLTNLSPGDSINTSYPEYFNRP